MGLEKASLKLAVSMTGVADAGLSKSVADIVKNHSVMGAIFIAFPFWGLETILYAIVLWGMYYKLCEKARVPFWQNFFTSVLGGYIVNLFVVFVLNIVLDFLPVINLITGAVIGYLATMFSGCAYLEALAALHDKGKVKERFNIDAAFNRTQEDQYLKEKVKQVTKTADKQCEDLSQSHGSDSELTATELEYYNEVKYCVAEGSVITDKERHLLNRYREKLGLSEEKAKEIEQMFIKWNMLP